MVHLAPALVGAPDPGLVLRRVRRDLRRRDRTGAVRRVRGRSASGGRRPRHLVQLGALALRRSWVARGHARAQGLLSDELPHDRAGDPLPVGRAHGDDGDRVPGPDSVPRRLRPPRDPGGRRAPDVEEPGHRYRSARRDRCSRRRRRAVRAPGHVVDAGRSLQPRAHPAGAGSRQQDVERVAVGAA